MNKLNIPESWAESTLELVDLLKHGQVNSIKDLTPDEECLVEMEDIEKDSGRITFDRPIPNKMSTKNRFKKGDVLYGKLRPYLNKCGVADRAGVCSSEIFVLTSDFFDSKYLAFYLRAPYFKNFVSDKVHGARMPRLSREVFQSSFFPFPSVKEQERIIQRIESYFEMINTTEANLHKVQTLLEKYRESLLTKAFRGELVLTDPKDEPASVLLEKIRRERSETEKSIKRDQEFAPVADNERPFELPTGWEWVRLGELVEFRRGHNPPKSEFKYSPQKGYVRFIQIQDFKTDDRAVYVPDSPQLKLCKKGDIMVSAYRHIGKYSREMEGAFNVALCHFNPRKYVSTDFIELLIPTSFIKGALLAVSERSMIPSMSVEVAAKLVVPLPPSQIQLKLIKELHRCEDLIANTTQKMKKLISLSASLKESVLQKAFEGRLVEQIPSEGTGHELLAKILSEKTSFQKAISEINTKKSIKVKVPAKAVTRGKKNGKK